MAELEKVDEFLYKLPEGAYFDDKGLLRSREGEKLPDGLYQNREGEVILYEGNFFEGNFLEMPLE